MGWYLDCGFCYFYFNIVCLLFCCYCYCMLFVGLIFVVVVYVEN